MGSEILVVLYLAAIALFLVIIGLGESGKAKVFLVSAGIFILVGVLFVARIDGIL